MAPPSVLLSESCSSGCDPLDRMMAEDLVILRGLNDDSKGVTVSLVLAGVLRLGLRPPVPTFLLACRLVRLGWVLGPVDWSLRSEDGSGRPSLVTLGYSLLR